MNAENRARGWPSLCTSSTVVFKAFQGYSVKTAGTKNQSKSASKSLPHMAISFSQQYKLVLYLDHRF